MSTVLSALFFWPRSEYTNRVVTMQYTYGGPTPVSAVLLVEECPSSSSPASL